MGVDEQNAVEALGARLTATAQQFWREADNMLAYLIKRADVLADHADNPLLEAELERVADVIDAYEAKRWPNGKMPDGKG